MVNKIDAADPVVLQGLRAREPGSLRVSAKTGAGLAALRDAIEAALPRLDVQVRVVVPYSRGDLVARAHAEGEVLRRRAHGRRHAAARPGFRPAWPRSWKPSAWPAAATLYAGFHDCPSHRNVIVVTFGRYFSLD